MQLYRLLLAGSIALLSACGSSDAPAPAETAPPVADAAPSLPPPPPTPVPPPPRIDGRGFVLMDFASGQVLAAANEHARMEPASLTKIMSSYVVFDALRTGKVQLTDTVTISEHAWRVGGASSDGSTSFLPVGSRVPVEVLLKGMIIQSGNDASIALAEHIAGSEETFAHLMNEYAKRLGMTGTNFTNATGLPAPDEYTTPHDMALLSAALVRDFPQYYPYYAEREFTYNNITQRNRNGLLNRDPTVDGIKTGHTNAAGYCLVSSAERGGMRLVSVVMGSPSIRAREEGTQALLNYGFGFYETHRVQGAGEALATTRVWKGAAEQVALVPKQDLVLAIPRGQAANLVTTIDAPASIVAPVDAATEIGRLRLTLEGQELGSWPLYPAVSVTEAGLFGRLADSVRMWFN